MEVEKYNPNDYKDSVKGEVVLPWDAKWVRPLLGGLLCRNVQAWGDKEVFNAGHAHCKQYMKGFKKDDEERVNSACSKQVHNHENMLKFSGSVMTNKCEKTSIEVGDLVYVRTDALYSHPKGTGTPAHEVDEYRDMTTHIDGAPKWRPKPYKVTVVVVPNERFRVDGLELLLRSSQVCKAVQLKVGDIVRVPLAQMKSYRKFMGGTLKATQIGKYNALRYKHATTYSLFMITHVRGDHTGPDTPPAPGTFLTCVWDASKKYGTQDIARENVWWETSQLISNPQNGNPHSVEFWRAQYKIRENGEGDATIRQKDFFQGIDENVLMQVDMATQRTFWDPKVDGDVRENFIDKWQDEVWSKNMKSLSPPVGRLKYMVPKAAKWTRCHTEAKNRWKKRKKPEPSSALVTLPHTGVLEPKACRTHAYLVRYIVSSQ